MAKAARKSDGWGSVETTNSQKVSRSAPDGYAITTSYKNSVSVDHVSDRASAYGMPGVLVDGQDAIAVWEATNEAVLRARAGEGPTLIEAMTYRYEDHSLGLDRIRKSEYRTQGEVEEAMILKKK